jgi:hypothetical protein
VYAGVCMYVGVCVCVCVNAIVKRASAHTATGTERTSVERSTPRNSRLSWRIFRSPETNENQQADQKTDTSSTNSCPLFLSLSSSLLRSPALLSTHFTHLPTGQTHAQIVLKSVRVKHHTAYLPSKKVGTDRHCSLCVSHCDSHSCCLSLSLSLSLVLCGSRVWSAKES